MDKRLAEHDVDMEQLERALLVSLWCIQEQPSQRPSMGKVVQMLEGVSAIDRPPAPKAADGGLAVVTSITIFATSSPAQPSMGSSHSIAGTSLVSKRNLDKPTSSMVVRAKKKDTGNVYALKIMDKKFIAKENKVSYVKMERIVLDQLDHPGIIRLCFTFQDTHSLYMALECCEGGELFDQITRKGYLSEDEARFYAAEVVDALEYIHGVGLIHRDIKPENLLLTADGHIKIADFGSVKPTRDSQMTVLPSSSNEKACTFVGTAAYVPPEVLNSCPATFANDLWALGCTLYQMLSGSSPFKDASEWLIFQRIITRDLKFPEFFSHEARDLIDKLLIPVKDQVLDLMAMLLSRSILSSMELIGNNCERHQHQDLLWIMIMVWIMTVKMPHGTSHMWVVRLQLTNMSYRMRMLVPHHLRKHNLISPGWLRSTHSTRDGKS
ncbi:3-phosphoinositide-dependent protein kinase 1-like isoform X3 [Musa acuminata AAA Group]|uniref:3-phosphoinositide-dependent protein kinase 1-like isoform X3 n=1 Tax=Musa acuminata AAA Group TaxID=214697 RepID=UPI0031DCD7E2